MSDRARPHCPACAAPLRRADRFCATCGEPAPNQGDAADPLVGRTLAGRFRIIERLGEGGMAVVYRAEQTAVGRPVALKVLRARHAGDQAQYARFQREARAISRLNHPNTITVFDFGHTEDDQLFIAMEFVDGENLTRLRKGGPLPWRRVVDIGVQVCASLQHAHDHGVIHRDLKSQNIMVTQRSDAADVVKVLDFGIAKARFDDDDPLLTTPNITLGTPDVMAPEVLVGEPATAQADIYALGVVLYELLTGRRVFPFDKVGEVVHAQMFATPDPFDAVLPDHRIPASIEALVLELLAKKPADRPATMRDVGRRLERLRRDETAPLPSLDPEPSTPDAETLPPRLRRLMHRIEGSLDFPAFAANVTELNALCDRDDVTPDQLADVVLRDYAITQKLLRMVNSAWYRRGSKPVSTISRAVVMLGFEQVRRIATSLMYWQHLSRTGDAQAQLDAAVRSLGSAMLARQVARGRPDIDGEQAFICAMFQSFGRQLVLHHLPDDAAAVRALMSDEGKSEPEAALQVLGATYEAIGAGIAEHLSFPETVVGTMRPLSAEAEAHPTTPAEKLAAVAAFSNGVAEALESPPERRAEKLAAVQQRFGEGLDLTPARTQALLAEASEALMEVAAQLDIEVDDSPLLAGMQAQAALDPAEVEAARRKRPRLQPDLDDPAAILDAAVKQAAELAGTGSLNDVVVTAMEGLFRGAGFDRVFFGLKDFKTGRFTARLALGGDARERLKSFAVSADGAPDLIRTALTRGTDLVVRDARLPTVRARLPAWFLERMDPAAFGLYPVMVRGVCVGLLYGDSRRKGHAPRWLQSDVQAPIQALRAQVVVALGALGKKRRS